MTARRTALLVARRESTWHRRCTHASVADARPGATHIAAESVTVNAVYQTLSASDAIVLVP